jgi:hypothetical protein
MAEYLYLPTKYQPKNHTIMWKYYPCSITGHSAGGCWINTKGCKPVSLYDVFKGDDSYWLAEAYTLIKGCHWCYTEEELLKAEFGVDSLLEAYYKLIEDNKKLSIDSN